MELKLNQFNNYEKTIVKNFLDNHDTNNFNFKDANEEEKLAWNIYQASFNDTKRVMILAKYYFESVDLHNAFRWFKFLTKRNNNFALYRIGNYYEKGIEVQQCYKTAFQYYLKAAQSALISAQCRIGCLYENGFGVEKNLHFALKWYLKASEQNNPFAICSIAHFYENGLGGLEKNHEKAYALYSKAEKKNYTWAMYKIGLMYENGNNFPTNLEEALKYFMKGIEFNSNILHISIILE